MTERVECCLCGTSQGTIRDELFRRLVFEPGQEYDFGPRCTDRERCRSTAESRPSRDPGRPAWNVAEGPAVQPKVAPRLASLAAPLIGPPRPERGQDPEQDRPPTAIGSTVALWR